MAYHYEIIILDPKLHRYIEEADSSDSFVDALSRMFLRNLPLCDKVLQIYCRKPLSGDFQYMGSFDGISSISSGAHDFRRRLLRLANGLDYYLTDNGFIRNIG